MKSNKKIIIIAIALVLVYVFMLFRPRTFEQVIGNNGNEIYAMACYTAFSHDYMQGDVLMPGIDSYTISSEELDAEGLEYILELLEQCKYRPAIVNYSPILIKSVGSSDDFENKSVTLNMVWGNELKEGQSIHITGGTKVILSRDGEGLKVYHATDKELIHQLSAYIQEHGTLNE